MSEENWSIEEHYQRMDHFMRKVAADCRHDPEVRAELDADPRAFLTGRGLKLPDGPEVAVAANTAEVHHLVMPKDPNATLADENLDRVAGGGGATPPSSHLQDDWGNWFSCVNTAPQPSRT